jgi:hypothetical protein
MTTSYYGTPKVNGYAVLPSQRPSTLSFFTLTIVGQDATGEATVTNGAYDQVFRTALSNFATVAMIGTPAYAASNTTLRFALEDTGADSLSSSGLGLGNANSGTYPDTTSTLQVLVRALGNAVGPNNADLSTALVRSFTL